MTRRRRTDKGCGKRGNHDPEQDPASCRHTHVRHAESEISNCDVNNNNDNYNNNIIIINNNNIIIIINNNRRERGKSMRPAAQCRWLKIQRLHHQCL